MFHQPEEDYFGFSIGHCFDLFERVDSTTANQASDFRRVIQDFEPIHHSDGCHSFLVFRAIEKYNVAWMDRIGLRMAKISQLDRIADVADDAKEPLLLRLVVWKKGFVKWWLDRNQELLNRAVFSEVGKEAARVVEWWQCVPSRSNLGMWLNQHQIASVLSTLFKTKVL